MLEFGIQFVLNVLDEVIDFLQLIIFRLRHFINRILDILHVLMELFKPFLKDNGFFLDNLTVLIVNLLDSHELMIFVRIAKHMALRADGYLASLTEVVDSNTVLFANLSSVFQNCAIIQHGWTFFFFRHRSRQYIKGSLNFC